MSQLGYNYSLGQSIRVSSIRGILLSRSQKRPHQQRRSFSADRHRRTKTLSTAPWLIQRGQAVGWKLRLAIPCSGSRVTQVKPLMSLVLVPGYRSPFFPPWQVFALLIAQVQSTGVFSDQNPGDRGGFCQPHRTGIPRRSLSLGHTSS